MFTNLDEERHHVEELVDADGAVAVLVEEIEDAEQVVLGLAVAEQVEQHAHAVERWTSTSKHEDYIGDWGGWK